MYTEKIRRRRTEWKAAMRPTASLRAIRLFPLYSYYTGSLADLSLELEASVSRPGVPRVPLSFESRINARPVRTENRTERGRSGIKGNMILRICVSAPFSLSTSLRTPAVSLIKIHFVAPAPPTEKKAGEVWGEEMCLSRDNCVSGKWDSRHRILPAGRKTGDEVQLGEGRIAQRRRKTVISSSILVRAGRNSERLQTTSRIPGGVKYPVRALPQTFYCKCLAFSK